MGLAYNILTPAKAISKASYGVKKGNAAAERVMDILETENPIKERENAIEKSDFNSGIQLSNISFRYEEEFVLSEFNLEVVQDVKTSRANGRHDMIGAVWDGKHVRDVEFD